MVPTDFIPHHLFWFLSTDERMNSMAEFIPPENGKHTTHKKWWWLRDGLWHCSNHIIYLDLVNYFQEPNPLWPSSRDIFSRFFCAPDFFFPARFRPRFSGMEVPASEAVGATATDSWGVVTQVMSGGENHKMRLKDHEFSWSHATRWMAINSESNRFTAMENSISHILIPSPYY